MVIPKKKVDPGAHVAGIKESFPQFKVTRLGAGHYLITGHLQPTPDSPSYTVRVRYEKSLPRPEVTVVDPHLVNKPEHTFDDGSLCLFHAEDFDWNQPRVIADYIIPWTSKWLLYYEGWLLTGNWFGDEAAHAKRKTK